MAQTQQKHRNYATVYDLFGSKLIMHSMSPSGMIEFPLLSQCCTCVVTFAFYTLKDNIMVMLAWTKSI